MKARVIATGEIVEVYESCNEDFPWTDEMGDKVWKTEELIFLEITDNTPDYWTRLEHTYAGMAMQGILTNPIGFENIRARGRNIQVETALLASEFAHALVEKMKE
jgi:hypothetical protein